ncbi:25017_t:CDS:2, partial [Gigaspora rosea]
FAWEVVSVDGNVGRLAQRPIVFELGKPIHISWTAPKNHTHRDWIGIYKVTSNPSKKVTSVSSDLLPWEIGTYEFRYHHNDKYNVMAISQPFEI